MSIEYRKWHIRNAGAWFLIIAPGDYDYIQEPFISEDEARLAIDKRISEATFNLKNEYSKDLDGETNGPSGFRWL